jgi:hypothetical protein
MKRLREEENDEWGDCNPHKLWKNGNEEEEEEDDDDDELLFPPQPLCVVRLPGRTLKSR